MTQPKFEDFESFLSAEEIQKLYDEVFSTDESAYSSVPGFAESGLRSKLKRILFRTLNKCMTFKKRYEEAEESVLKLKD